MHPEQHHGPPQFKTAKMKKKFSITRRNFIRLCILGFLAFVGAKGFRNTRKLELVRLKVGLKRLPSAFDGLKVGQITDIHAGPLVPAELIREGVDMIMAHRPDVIVLTGDFVSSATKFLWTSFGGFTQRHYEYCMKELGRLKAPLGVFAVLGNHDFWSGHEAALKIARGLKGRGVQVLRNEAVPIERKGQRLYIVGVDDYWEGSYSLSRALKNVPQDACLILLSHNPDVNEDIENSRQRIDFIISGHTHGGQIVLPFKGALYIPSPFGQKYRAGLVRDQKRQTYVSRGLGLFFIPVRINCPPEVSLLALEKG
jgi:predicted MPP superfamily phosphohydrolase